MKGEGRKERKEEREEKEEKKNYFRTNDGAKYNQGNVVDGWDVAFASPNENAWRGWRHSSRHFRAVLYQYLFLTDEKKRISIRSREGGPFAFIDTSPRAWPRARLMRSSRHRGWERDVIRVLALATMSV